MTVLPPDYVPLTWDQLVPYEREQGGYWCFTPDGGGVGKVWVRVARPDTGPPPYSTPRPGVPVRTAAPAGRPVGDVVVAYLSTIVNLLDHVVVSVDDHAITRWALAERERYAGEIARLDSRVPPTAATGDAVPVDPVVQGRPALAWLLGRNRAGVESAHWPFVGPNGECADCPFGAPSCERDPHQEPPNPADPGEGNYDCSLLDRHDIWGEQPPCTDTHWVTRARAELETATSPVEPGERALDLVARLVAALGAVGWRWLADELDALQPMLRPQSGRPPKLDPAALWAAYSAADRSR